MKFWAAAVFGSLLLFGTAVIDAGILPSKPSDDLEGYRTVETAITAKIQPTTRSSGQTGLSWNCLRRAGTASSPLAM